MPFVYFVLFCILSLGYYDVFERRIIRGRIDTGAQSPPEFLRLKNSGEKSRG